MSCGDEVRRMILKRSFTAGEKPTVPPNEDHRSGLWSPTDIYIGEQFFNAVDGTLYTRSNDGIEEVATSASAGEIMYKARVSQQGAEAPVLTEYINRYGTITPSYTDVGSYALSGFSELTTAGHEISLVCNNFGFVRVILGSATTLAIATRDSSDNQANGILGSGLTAGSVISTLTIIKY
jgi:hypothetical protein